MQHLFYKAFSVVYGKACFGYFEDECLEYSFLP